MARRKWTNEEVEEYRKSHKTVFYFNKEDSNVFVPKIYGFGRTINLAHPLSWLFIALIVGFIIWSQFFR